MSLILSGSKWRFQEESWKYPTEVEILMALHNFGRFGFCISAKVRRPLVEIWKEQKLSASWKGIFG